MKDFLLNPWSWYVAGPMITFVMVMLIVLGKNFGISSNLRTMCSLCGAGKYVDFFDFNWKSQTWNLVFVLGTIIGGFITSQFLTIDEVILLDAVTVQFLKQEEFQNIGETYLPLEIFGMEALSTIKGWLILIGGGFLVGFGTRYAGGCTSGHAISGLSNLQLPSLMAVIGFFIGGLIMTHFIFPLLF